MQWPTSWVTQIRIHNIKHRRPVLITLSSQQSEKPALLTPWQHNQQGCMKRQIFNDESSKLNLRSLCIPFIQHVWCFKVCLTPIDRTACMKIFHDVYFWRYSSDLNTFHLLFCLQPNILILSGLSFWYSNTCLDLLWRIVWRCRVASFSLEQPHDDDTGLG